MPGRAEGQRSELDDQQSEGSAWHRYRPEQAAGRALARRAQLNVGARARCGLPLRISLSDQDTRLMMTLRLAALVDDAQHEIPGARSDR
jgi:hypothetical protein